ncbi:MAG: hypothetical protein GY906_03840 [bacterium]|nr:hypothetical protein [bacterium]
MEYSDSELDRLVALKEQIENEVMRRPGVTAIGVGFRTRGGELENKLAVKVYVERKQRSSDIGDQLISFPGIPTDVEEMRKPQPDIQPYPPDHRKRYDPLVGGIEIGPAGDQAVGTLGGIVFDRSTRTPMLLTNWHVAAGTGSNPIGQLMCQPGNDPANGIGTVTRAILGETPFGWIDAAVAPLNGSRQYSQSMLKIPGRQTTGMTQGRLQMKVYKSGRTTSTTFAPIESLAVTVTVEYPVGDVTFLNQIMIRPFPAPSPIGQVSDSGDSGSLWLQPGTNFAIGLNFAGEGQNDPVDRAIVNPIEAVVQGMDITFSQ